MNKFKVGDKVNYYNKTYKVTDVYGGDDSLYDIKSDNKITYNDFYIEVEEKYLKHYKTPHQELLDLGWELEEDSLEYAVYQVGSNYITIDKLNKEYDHSFDRRYSSFIDLQLARILVRYLKELESNEN